MSVIDAKTVQEIFFILDKEPYKDLIKSVKKENIKPEDEFFEELIEEGEGFKIETDTESGSISNLKDLEKIMEKHTELTKRLSAFFSLLGKE